MKLAISRPKPLISGFQASSLNGSHNAQSSSRGVRNHSLHTLFGRRDGANPRHPNSATAVIHGRRSKGTTTQRTTHHTELKTRRTAAGFTGLRSLSVNHEA